MRTLTFGIVLPTYNRLDLLLRAMESIIEQTYENWFCVIIDDSTDNETANYFNSLNAPDSRISYIKNPENKGVNFTRNRGIDYLLKHVSGLSYITFLDDDDVYEKNTLSDAVTAINSLNQPDWLMAPVIDLDDSNKSLLDVKVQKPIYHYVKDYLTRTCLRGDGTHYISPEIMRNIRFNGDLRTGGEWQFFAKLSKNALIHFIPKGARLSRYLEGGLTNLNQSNHSFRAEQTKAVYNCICEHNLGKKEKMRFANSHIKSLVKSNQADNASAFIKEANEKQQLPYSSILKLKLRLLTYKLKH